jgi:hypothetical protein
MRKNLGVLILALSVAYSAAELSGWLRPSFLRMRAHGGSERLAAVILASLSLKAILLILGALLAFWPVRTGGGPSSAHES